MSELEAIRERVNALEAELARRQPKPPTAAEQHELDRLHLLAHPELQSVEFGPVREVDPLQESGVAYGPPTVIRQKTKQVMHDLGTRYVIKEEPDPCG